MKMVTVLLALFLTTDVRAQTIDLCSGENPATAPAGVPLTFVICAPLRNTDGTFHEPPLDSVRLDLSTGLSITQATRAIESNGVQARFPIGPVTLPPGPVTVSTFVGDLYSYTRADGTVVFNERRWSVPLIVALNQGDTPLPPCTIALGSPSTTTLPASATVGTIQLTTNCAWNSSATTSWMSVSPSSGSGSATLAFSATANTSTLQRVAQVKIGAASSEVITQLGAPAPPVQCTYSVAVNRQQFDRFGGSANISIATPVGCPWSIADNADWLRYTRISGTGALGVTLTVSRNSGRNSRTANVAIGGQVFTVQQAGR